MPYTDAGTNADNQDPWHVYAEDDVVDMDPDSIHTARSACLGREVNTGQLSTVKQHSTEAFFDSMTPQSLVDWLSHPHVCEECRREIAARLGIEMESVRAKMERGKREGRL